MKINVNNKNQHNPKFGNSIGYALTEFIEHRVLVNKALVDASVDVPMVLMANNNIERRERFNRVTLGWTLAFLSPFITLPLTNRLALKFIAKTYKSFSGKENHIIEISNKFLNTEKAAGKALIQTGKKQGFNAEQLAEKCGGFENLRKRLISAKNAVLAFDFLFTAGSLGSIGYFNNYHTKKKTGRKGFSAEFSMADENITDKRAQKYEKMAPLRIGTFAASVLALAALPIVIRKGLLHNSQKGFSAFLRRNSHLFDYDDGVCMKRVPMFLASISAYYGLATASRNQTELKDNLVRSMAGGGVFFGGDILIGSILARLSDRFLKTDIVDKSCKKSLLNKLIPPTKPLRDLNGRSRNIGIVLFWVNMVSLSALIGFGVPALLNKMIKQDVKKDIGFNQEIKLQNTNPVFKDFKL